MMARQGRGTPGRFFAGAGLGARGGAGLGREGEIGGHRELGRTMDQDLSLVTLDAIRQARANLPPAVVRTPLLCSEDMSETAGAPVWFKPENLQVTGSYKA